MKNLKRISSVLLVVALIFSSVYAGFNVAGYDELFIVEANAAASGKCSHTKTEVRDAAEATCYSGGYSGDTYCSDCGELLESGKASPRLKHIFVDEICKLCNIPLWQYGIYEGIGNIEQYNGYESDLVIPRLFDDGVQVKIGTGAFYQCETLTSVTILDNVVKIGMFAFQQCTKLSKVVIPDSVVEIGMYAFVDCVSLASVTIPGSVTKISDKAFGYCNVDGSEVKLDGFKIYGVLNSAAHTYATENGFIFIDVNTGTVYEPETVCKHNKSDWIIDEKATVYKAGSKHKECTKCGKILETETVAQRKCSKPTLKEIENTEYGVLIKWGKVKGADSYRVYRKTSKSDWEYLDSTKNTYFTDKTAKSGTKYYYAVRARNEAGNSSLASELSKYYLANPTLNDPSSTTKGIGLKWSKVTGAQGYMVYRKTSGGSYSRIATEKGADNIAFRDSTAKKGTKYYYKVKAYYSKTYSAYSSTKSVTDKY